MFQKMEIPKSKTAMIKEALLESVEGGEAFFYPLDGKKVTNVQGALRAIANRMGIKLHYKTQEDGLVVWGESTTEPTSDAFPTPSVEV